MVIIGSIHRKRKVVIQRNFQLFFSGCNNNMTFHVFYVPVIVSQDKYNFYFGPFGQNRMSFKKRHEDNEAKNETFEKDKRCRTQYHFLILTSTVYFPKAFFDDCIRAFIQEKSTNTQQVLCQPLPYFQLFKVCIHIQK